MDLVEENYLDTLTESCKEALKFLNIYASKIHTSKEDVGFIRYYELQVLLLLEEYGLSFEIASKVVEPIIKMSYEYRDHVDSLIHSMVSCKLVDFDWSLKV